MKHLVINKIYNILKQQQISKYGWSSVYILLTIILCEISIAF